MPLTSLYTCSRCKKEFNFNNVKYDETKNLICVDCLKKKQKLEKKEKLKSEKPEGQEPINFICVSCRFKFSVKKARKKRLSAHTAAKQN